MVDRVRPAPSRDDRADLSDQGYEEVNEERIQVYRGVQAERRYAAAARTREAFISGADQSWEVLGQADARSLLKTPAGLLEAATTDTYLALDTQTATR